jgi:hypothetical protein
MSADRVVRRADVATERALQMIKIIVAFVLVLSFSVGAQAGARKHHHTYAYGYGNGYNPYGYYNPFDYYPGEYHWCGMGYFERHGGCDPLF